MQIQCPNCNATYTFPDDKIPVSGAYGVCKNCKKKFFIGKPSALNKDNVKRRRIVCPSCGFEQDPSETCLKCGIVFSKYLKLEQKKGSDIRDGQINDKSRKEKREFEEKKEKVFPPSPQLKSNKVLISVYP